MHIIKTMSKKEHNYDDPLMDEARKLVQETGIEMQGFVSEKLGIDYARAGYILDGLETDGSIKESPTWLYQQYIKVYLDIDGVLLVNDKQGAHGVHEFVKYLVNRYSVYWLTTHCRKPGDDPLPMLSSVLDKKTIAYLEKVQPVYWDTLKTEGIDFSSEFVWFDDDLLEAEAKELDKHGATLSWVEIDLAKDPDQLSKVVRIFESKDDPLKGRG